VTQHRAARTGGISPGGDSFLIKPKLLEYCQWLAETRYPPNRGRGMQPSGVRIYYYTLLALLRQHPLALIDLLADGLPLPLEHRFLDLAPTIARRLALDFKHVLRLLHAEHPAKEALRFLSRHPLAKAPRLHWTPEHLEGIHSPLHQRWQRLWSACWRQAEADHVECLRRVVQTSRLLAAPIAPGGLPGKAALKLLRQRLEQDRQARPRVISPVAYLYEEPLADWLARPLLSGQWLFCLCQALAALADAVPALVRQRAAELKAKTDAAAQQGHGRQPDTRRIPPAPQGHATAEAIFFYAVAAWQTSLPAESSGQLILVDARLLSPRQFEKLLTLAISATEHLLWDSTLAVRTLPEKTPERQKRLRQALLPPRLRKLHEHLNRRERWRRAGAQAQPPPAWETWETCLRQTLDLIDARLAASIPPAAITSATLERLLRLPRAALAGQYLYQMPLGAWLRVALPADLPDGDALLQFCQTLAGALGAWPPDTPGAPASAEQAGRAVFWFTKLALEARLDNLSDSTTDAPDQERATPRRKDGSLAVWLGKAPLPAEALELATAIAPLIARVLFQSSWEAAREGQPLLVARLQAGDQESIDRMTRQFAWRARVIGHPNIEEAVEAAWRKLHDQLERVILPTDISLSMLTGDREMVAILDFWGGVWYSNNRNSYQFLGSITAFACSFIRPPDMPVLMPEGFGAGGSPPGDAAPGGSDAQDDILADDRAAVRVLELILQAAQVMMQDTRAAPAAGLEPSDGAWLLEGIFGNNSGRALVKRLAAQGELVAREIIKLWQSRPRLAQDEEQFLAPGTGTEHMDYNTALIRFLASQSVQLSPALRRAVGDLFELPMRRDQKEPSLRARLGMMERLGARTTRQRLRAELLRALAAVEHVPPAQRQALGKHLVAQEPAVLALRLLEQSGWVRPPWLRIPAPEAADAANNIALWLDGGGHPASTPEERKRQLFSQARRRWHRQLSNDASPQRVRALAAELLGIHFWHHAWTERLDQEQIRRFYRTLLNALPPHLRAVMGAAWMVATEQKLASLSELVGLIDCLPPQLPAQVDQPAFFAAMQQRLAPKPGEENDETSAEDANTLPPVLRLVRRDLRAARWRTYAWFLALAGLAEDTEYRLLLAAMSLAGGDANQVGDWLDGQTPSQAEIQALLQEVKRWNSQTSITEELIPRLLRSAAEQVRPIWQQLRKEPLLRKSGKP
jgi:hypothetical protein